MTDYHAKVRGLKLVRSFVSLKERDAWVDKDPENRIKVKKRRQGFEEVSAHGKGGHNGKI